MEQNVTIALTHRLARLADVPLLAQMNHQLIRDEGHENPMTLPELAIRHVLGDARVVSAIVGFADPMQVDEAVELVG